jgi:hypothetical protein
LNTQQKAVRGNTPCNTHKEMTMREHALELRRTCSYGDGWSLMDEWDTVGTYVVRRRFVEQLAEDADAYEEPGTVLLVRVKPDAQVTDADTVRRALESTLSGSNCTHEYDCCGCVSTHATARLLHTDTWLVQQTHTRNY